MGEELHNQITSVGDLISSIRDARTASQKAIWFRGQKDSTWKLMPGLLRQDCKVSEGTLLSRFKQSAAMLVGSNPDSEFDWIFLMQHYGVPTRLLDWTENPLVALYFSVNDVSFDEKKMDSALWMLRPSELNMNAHINDKDEGDYIPSFDDDEIQGYSTTRLRQNQRLKLYPIATIATRNNPRIQAQLGTFTIHHNEKISIDEVGDKKHCSKFVVPWESRASIREELSMLGVNRFSLFPEMDSIGGILKELI